MALLAQAGEESSRAVSRPDESGVRLLVGAVRRRRNRRHAVRSVAGAALVGAIGAASWVGLGRQAPVVPVQTPTTSPTASPDPSPSVTASPTVSSATRPTPTSSPGFPAAVPLPDGLLEQATAGWVLAVHHPVYAPQDDLAGEDGVEVGAALYLLSPQGERYKVRDLPLEQPVRLLHWAAGETRALVAVGSWDDTPGSTPAWIDLRTGEVSDVAGASDGIFVGMRADGTTLWRDGRGGGWEIFAVDDAGDVRDRWSGPSDVTLTSLSPRGDAVALDAGGGVELLDLGSGSLRQVSAPPGSCSTVAWATTTELLVRCMADDPGSDGTQGTVYAVDTQDAASAPAVVAETAMLGGVPARGAALSDGRVVVSVLGSIYADCATGVQVLDGAQLRSDGTPWSSPGRIDTVGSRAYVEDHAWCGGPAEPLTLTVRDYASGSSLVLAADPGAVPDGLADGPQRWVSGLTSWALGG